MSFARGLIISLALVTSLAGIALARHDAHDYRIMLASSDNAHVGDSRSLSLTISAQPGYVISRQGPLLVTLATRPDSGVSVPRQRYLRQHAADSRADSPRFDLYYKALRPGQYTMNVELRFWVCGSVTCRPVRTTRAVRLDIRIAEP